MRSRSILAILVALIVSALVAACGGSDTTTANDAGAGTSAAAEPVQITFSYDWPTVDFEIVPLVVAQEKGYLKDAGIDVKVIFPPDPASAT